MTEQLFPDEMVNDLFAGSLPVADVPASLLRVASVVHAARQAAAFDELGDIAILTQRFTAEVAANGPVSVLTPRSSSMIASRISRLAAAIVAITLLAAGTAAAAAGGGAGSARPSFASAEEVGDDTSTTAGPSTTEEEETTTTQASTTTAAASDDLAPEAPATPVVAEPGTTVHDPETADHFGKCTAWTNGTAKKPTNPAFAELQTAADSGAVTTDGYCAEILAARAATHADDQANDDDQADVDQADDDEADDDQADDSSAKGGAHKGDGTSNDRASHGKGHGNGG